MANQDGPKSLQSKYPPVDGGEPEVRRNDVKITVGPSNVRGYDAATSKEVPEQRGEREQTYRNSDGTLTTEFSKERINYRKPDGSWAPIDTTFVPDGDGWRNSADSVALKLHDSARPEDMARVRFDDDHEIAFGLRGTASSTAQVNGSTITYPDVFPGTDLRFESQPGGVKEIMVLDSPNSPREWTFPLRLKGLTAKVVDGRVALLDRDGREKARFPRGFMTDSKIDPHSGDPALSHGVKYEIAGNDLKVSVDDAWLRDPGRQYPVFVDPTIEGAVATDSRFYLGGGYTGGGQDLKIGTYDGGTRAATYLKFDRIEQRLSNHKIFGAALSLTNYWSWSCSPRPVTVHAVEEPWHNGGYPGPRVGGALAEKSFAHGFIAIGSTKSNCPTASEQIDLGTPGRDLVQRWVNGEQANHGLSVRASETDAYGWKKFTGHSTANPPKLFVTHTPYDAEYHIEQGVPDPPVHAMQGGDVLIKVTNKGKDTWTPSTFALGYRVFNAANGALVAHKEDSGPLPQDVRRGESVTVKAHIDAISEGDYLFDFSMLRKGGPWFTDEQIPPARLSFHVYDVPPVVKKQYPPNGYSSATLTPQLWVDAIDLDSPPDKPLQYRFEVCENYVNDTGVGCIEPSGWLNNRTWTVPRGQLKWSKDYQWRAFAFDGKQESLKLPPSHLLTAVPQPDITSRLATAPYNGANKAFSPMNGNYFSSAVDVSVATAGPRLDVTRTYNSLDPRRDLMFGAGWSTRWDMRVVEDRDGSGNVVVTYPDGQQVRFGRNANGTYAPPPGRRADLHQQPATAGDGWILVDSSGMVYQFRAPDGKLARVYDGSGNAVEISYDGRGRIFQLVSHVSDRRLTFGWVGDHVRTVTTDPVDGKTFTWTYDYDGDKLKSVCDPKNGCTRYDYTPDGSHYRSAVIDSIPGSYWRLGDPEGNRVESQIRTNLRNDDATANDVTWIEGGLEGTGDGARTFNGTSSFINLPNGLIRKNRDLSVELWFKTTTGGPLLGMQDFAWSTEPKSPSLPVLYVGLDGKLRGQFANGKTTPITTTNPVNDGNWHHVVLSGSLATQSLFLNGALVGTADGEIDHATMEFSQLGAAYSTDGWPSWNPSGLHHFKGEIDEVAFYEHALGETAALGHFLARKKAESLAKITLPSGRVAATMAYDVVNDRMKEYVDRDGGTWKLSVPEVTGTVLNVVRSAHYVDPGNRSHFFDFDPKRGRLLRAAEPLGQGVRPEDQQTPGGEPVVSPTCPSGPDFCGGPPPGSPPWEGGPNRGQGVRTYDYDDRGFPSMITDEMGNRTFLTNDERGKPVQRKTCRVAPNDCQTSYATYFYNPDNLVDPRNDEILSTSDARSSGPEDTKYRTTYTYTDGDRKGLLWTQRLPDGSTTTHTYTSQGSPSPLGLVETSTDGRNAMMRFTYYTNGDLKQVENPSKLRTEFAYDALGRKSTSKEFSDQYPQGLTTTFTYDELSRQKTITSPQTTNAVTGAKHTLQKAFDYDADGNVIAVEVRDLTGGDATRRTTIERDDRGRPMRMADAEGNETTSGYDGFGNQVWTVDAVGNKYEFAYTARNALAEVRLRGWHGDPVGPGGDGGDGEGDKTVKDTLVVQSYAYDLAGRLSRATDGMGRTKRFEYYQDDKLRKVSAVGVRDPFDTNAPPRTVVLEENLYDAAGNLSRRVTPGGLTTEFTYDVVGRVKTQSADPAGLARATAFDYDLAGNITKVTQSGKPSNSTRLDRERSHVVEYGYDTAGRQTTETVVNGAERLVTVRTYDRRNLVRTVTDPRGAGFTTDLGYDELRRQISVTSPQVTVEKDGGAPTQTRPVVQFGFDTFGGVTDFKDANGNVTSTTFDKVGRQVRTESPEYTKPGEQAGARAVTETSYDPLGNVRKVVDPRGAVTEMRYDQLNRLVRRLDPDPAQAGRTKGVWQYSYTRVGEQLSVTDPTGSRVEATYDDLGRRITSTQLERYPTPAAYTTTLGYDDANNLKTVKSPSDEVTTLDYDVLGQRIKQTDPADVVTQYGFDFAGQQVRVSDGMARTTFQTYDDAGRPSTMCQLDASEALLRLTRAHYDKAGNVIKTTNALQRDTTYTYDAANRLQTQTEPVTDTHTITTSFGYDAAGNRTRFTDGRGNKTIYTVNPLGLGESVIEPSTTAHPQAADRTWTTAYDLAGNPESLKAPGNVTRTRSFDLLGRLTGETGAGAEESTDARVLRYDDAGRLLEVNAPGGTNIYTYNDRGSLLTTEGPSGTSSFGYDKNGRMSTRSDESGTATYAYLQGRLASTRDAVTGLTEAVGYNGAGQVKNLDYGAGRSRVFGYDEFGRQKTDTLSNNDIAVASISYGYDTADRLKTKTIAGMAGAGTNTYDYDYANRLTSWTFNNSTTAYDWDDAGNRIKSGAKTSEYDERNRLKSDGDYTYKWSARGTMAARVSSGLEERYGFDAFDRAVSRDDDARYAYDGLDRVNTRNGKKFSYAGQSLDLVSDGESKFGRGAGNELMSLSQGADTRVAVTDSHGDVVGGFAPEGSLSLADSASFDPFGQAVASSGAKRPLGFQGDYTDPATGDVDMGARWYSPRTGGFTARDSVEALGSPSGVANRYAYGIGAPTNHTDPTGNYPAGCTVIKDPGFGPIIIDCPPEEPDGPPVSWCELFSCEPNGGGGPTSSLPGGGSPLGGQPGTNPGWSPGKKPGGYVPGPSPEQITQQARDAAANAARNNPLPQVPAATQPLYAGTVGNSTNPPVSSDPDKPAQVTWEDIQVDIGEDIRRMMQNALDGKPIFDNVGPLLSELFYAFLYPGAFRDITMDVVHLTLDLVGLVPGFGEVFDGLNALIYLAEGNYQDAALSGIGMIPFAGWAGTGLKWGSKFSPEVAEWVGKVFKTCNSFIADTQVLMADGSHKAIQDVQVGDEVIATDPTTGETGVREVTDLISTDKEHTLVALTVDVDGDRGDQTAVITATDRHPFWVDDQSWRAAEDLAVGDELETSDGDEVKVVATAKRTEVSRVYNFTVDGLHTYYVLAGTTPVLVHNCGKDIYEAGGKHGPAARSTSRGMNSPEPKDGQAALGNSIQVKGTAPRRVGVDKKSGEIVVLDRTRQAPCGCSVEGGVNNIWHGHVRPWDDLHIDMQNALRRAGLVDRKGRIR